MAQLALGLVGAAVGSFFGAPGLGFALGSMAGSLLFPSGQDQTYTGPRLGDLTVSSSAYGAGITRGAGTGRISGNMIWCPGIEEVSHTEEQSAGKGGGPSVTSTTYTYFASFALGLCNGVKGDALRIWADGKLIYDGKASTGNDGIMTGLNFRFYPGSETQMPDPTIVANQPDAPAYRGLCYIVFDRLPLANFGNRIPSITVEVAENSQLSRKSQSGTPVDTTIQRGSLEVDLKRRRIYIYSLDGQAHFTVWNLDTMQFIEKINFADMFATSPGSIWAYQPTEDGWLLFYNESYQMVDCWYVSKDSKRMVKRITQADGTLRVWAPSASTPNATGFGKGLSGLSVQDDICVYAAFGDAAMVFVACNTGIASQYGPTGGSLLGNRAISAASLVQGTSFKVLTTVGYSPSLGANPTGVYMNMYEVNGLALDGGAAAASAGGIPLARQLSGPVLIDMTPYLAAVGATYMSACWPYYDRLDGNWLLVTNINGNAMGQIGLVMKWSETLGIMWVKTYSLTLAPVYYAANQGVEVVSGQLCTCTPNGHTVVIDTTTGNLLRDDPWLLGPGVPQPNGFYQWMNTLEGWVLNGDAGLSAPVVKYYYRNLLGSEKSLADYISELWVELGQNPADIDVSALTDTFPGYYVGRPTTVRELLQPLAAIYFFDAVESDFKLKFVKRGQNSVVTITQDDLQPTANDGSECLQETITQELELPARVSVLYADSDHDYQQNLQPAIRPSNPRTTSSSQKPQISTPVYISATTAKRAAERTLYTAWTERSQYSLAPGYKYIWLDPTDVFTLQMSDGTTFKMRMLKQETGADLSQRWTAVGEEGANYASTAIGDGGQIPNNQIGRVVPSRVFFLDVPFLRDVDATGSTVSTDYVGMTSWGSTDWRSGQTFYSRDAGVSWTPEFSATKSVAWGTAQTKLPDNLDPFATDYTTVLQVSMAIGGDRLQNCTYDQMMNGANAMAVQCSNGEWEIIQFMTVSPTGGSVYQLSGLTRGARGTDWLVGLHNPGDVVVYLEPTALQFREWALGDLNIPFPHRAVSSGQYIEDAPQTTFTSKGNELRPYMPRQLAAAKSGSDIAISWVRRTRYNGEWLDGTETVPLNEDAEKYDLEILSGPSGTIVRTVSDLTTPAYTYLAANIATDFGSTPTALTMRVYQKNAAVGRGFTREITVQVN